ncbi:glycosyltransferase [Paenibacillus sp. 2TAB23]|uniref:glycosyltransferase n=1 Tax=Paenibacillus sp. 2TAB23 TaxID=3233004 RepID=UPI003F96C08A
MLLGVHLIVRNEADVLERCLKSVKAFADEIIVADTGSSDETKQIALRFGARVLEIEWEEDFAEARNKALLNARTLWVLVLDADEWVDCPAQIGIQLREELKRTPEAALRIKMEHMLDTDDAGGKILNEAIRIFRADRGFVYVGEIHEQLVRIAGRGTEASRKVDVDGPLSQSGIVIRHDGYLPAAMARKEKAIRNERIIARQLSKRPNDPFCLYNYGVALCQLGKLDEACQAFGRSLVEVRLEAPFRPAIIRDYAKVLLVLRRIGQAEALLEEETLQYSDYPDLFLLQGDALRAGGRLLEAIHAYEAAINAESIGRGSRYLAEAGAGNVLAHIALAEIWLELEQLDKAQLLFERVLLEKPFMERGYNGLAACHHAAGKSDSEIYETLLSAAGKQPKGELLIARSMTRVGAFGTALPLWRKLDSSLNAGEWLSENVCLYARVLIGEGYLAEAAAKMNDLQIWPANENESRLMETAIMDIVLCSWNEGLKLNLKDEGILFLKLKDDDHLVLVSIEAAVLKLSAQEKPQAPWQESKAAWGRKLLERAVALGMLHLADQMVQADERLDLIFEQTLYDEGYKDAAAERMLRSYAATGELAGGQWLRLGELLYIKGLYSEALGMFEQGIAVSELAEKEPLQTTRRLRLGAAAASLRLALEALSLAGPQDSRTWDGSWAETDAVKLLAALQRIDGLGWRTKWNGVQRRRANGQAAEANFLMHDR